MRLRALLPPLSKMVVVDEPIVLILGALELLVALVDHVVHQLGHADDAGRALPQVLDHLGSPAQAAIGELCS
eukprot:834538-Prymnesium_polylepis.1